MLRGVLCIQVILTIVTARIAWSSHFGKVDMGTLYTTDFLKCTLRLPVAG